MFSKRSFTKKLLLLCMGSALATTIVLAADETLGQAKQERGKAPLFLTMTNGSTNYLAIVNTQTKAVDYVATGGLGGASGNAGGVAAEGDLAAAVNFNSSNVTIFVRRGNAMEPAQMIKTAFANLMLVAFGAMFQDYRTERFVSQGMVCLTAGLLQAIPAGLASWWLLRRGFAVDSATAGIARGTLAGLAGVGMLELHCTNFETPHVMLWHTAVVPLSGLAVWLLVRGGRWMREQRRLSGG